MSARLLDQVAVVCGAAGMPGMVPVYAAILAAGDPVLTAKVEELDADAVHADHESVIAFPSVYTDTGAAAVRVTLNILTNADLLRDASDGTP